MGINYGVKFFGGYFWKCWQRVAQAERNMIVTDEMVQAGERVISRHALRDQAIDLIDRLAKRSLYITSTQK
jgi:hypothetical protein